MRSIEIGRVTRGLTLLFKTDNSCTVLWLPYRIEVVKLKLLSSFENDNTVGTLIRVLEKSFQAEEQGHTILVLTKYDLQPIEATILPVKKNHSSPLVTTFTFAGVSQVYLAPIDSQLDEEVYVLEILINYLSS